MRSRALIEFFFASNRHFQKEKKETTNEQRVLALKIASVNAASVDQLGIEVFARSYARTKNLNYTQKSQLPILMLVVTYLKSNKFIKQFSFREVEVVKKGLKIKEIKSGY